MNSFLSKESEEFIVPFSKIIPEDENSFSVPVPNHLVPIIENSMMNNREILIGLTNLSMRPILDHEHLFDDLAKTHYFNKAGIKVLEDVNLSTDDDSSSVVNQSIANEPLKESVEMHLFVGGNTVIGEFSYNVSPMSTLSDFVTNYNNYWFSQTSQGSLPCTFIR